MNIDLSGKTALVTGATSGIGRAVAYQLASQGASVLVHGRNVDRGIQVVEEIQLTGEHARFIGADLGTTQGVQSIIGAAGDVDILVNNAGFSWFGPTDQLSPEKLDSLFGANVQAVYQLVAGIAPRMAERGSGSIVSVASMAGQIGLVGGAAYGATRLSLVAFTRAWAAEYSPAGVRVNAVSPGPVYTATNPDRTAALGKTTLLGRAARADEIASVIGFISSPAAGYITGAVIPVEEGPQRDDGPPRSERRDPHPLGARRRGARRSPRNTMADKDSERSEQPDVLR